jgi:sugar O-acyltransferase (sialic acid O-acetyltransferase NeuD family)
MIRDIVIIGSGGLGREIAAVMNKNFRSEFNIIGYVDDYATPNSFVNNHKVMGSIDWLIEKRPCENVIIGFSDIKGRSEIINKLISQSFIFPSIIHPDAILIDCSTIKIGAGTIILPYSIITTNVEIGDYVLLHMGIKIHHDTQIKNNCVIMPNVLITGGAKIGNNVYIGTGAICPVPICIHDNVNIKAGTVVFEDQF